MRKTNFMNGIEVGIKELWEYGNTDRCTYAYY